MYFFIYETKGLSLEEVDELYAEVKGINAAKNSVNWQPSVTFQQREAGGAEGGVFAGGDKEKGLDHSEGNGEGNGV